MTYSHHCMAGVLNLPPVMGQIQIVKLLVGQIKSRAQSDSGVATCRSSSHPVQLEALAPALSSCCVPHDRTGAASNKTCFVLGQQLQVWCGVHTETTPVLGLGMVDKAWDGNS